MPFYEVHLHNTEETISRIVIRADSQAQARRAALEAIGKDHDDVVEHAVWEDEWVQLGEITGPSEPDFNYGDSYWDADLNKWTSPRKQLFANEEEGNTPVGNPKRLGRSVDWTPYEDRGNWGNPIGRPGNHQRAEDWTAPKIEWQVNDTVDAYDLQECPWCGDDMEHDGDFEDWGAYCSSCDGSINLQTTQQSKIVSIDPPTEKWTTDLADFSAEQTPQQLVEGFRETVRDTMNQLIQSIEDSPDPTITTHKTLKALIDTAFQLGYNSGNIDGKWEMKQDMMRGYSAESREVETPIVDRALRLHMMIERATHHAMVMAMKQQALLSMLQEEGAWIEHKSEEIDFDWTPEEFGMIEAKELVGEIADMQDHLGDLENQYEYAVEEDNEDLEYLVEEKILECKEDIEYLIHLLYEVEAFEYSIGGSHE